jgi:hypothetical protein
MRTELPRGERGHPGPRRRTLRRLSPSGMQGIVIGGFAGTAVAVLIGTVVGMVLGVVAGEWLERTCSSASASGAEFRSA